MRLLERIASAIRRAFAPPPVITQRTIQHITLLPRTHNVRLDGVMCSLLTSQTSAPSVVLTGFTSMHWQWLKGDFLVLHYPSGSTTRYEIKNMRRPGGDLYFAECRFAPRGRTACR